MAERKNAGWPPAGQAWTMPEIVGLLGLLAFVLVCTLAAWTPSHYHEAAALLGMEDLKPLFGGSRTARSDEWGVVTAYYQIAVRSELGPVDLVSPYHESLKTFFALPSRDWSMAFKPDLWAFLVLDPARAYGFHFAFLAASALLGVYLLLRQLGCRREAAAVGAGLLFFSQFVQTWWTSNAPALALAAWPAVAYLWRAPWPARIPALAAATAALLIGELYPPFVIAGGLALAVAIAAFRPDALRLPRLAAGLAGLAAGVGIAWLHYADLIPVMAATVYPGQRVSDGGGVHLLQLAAHIFPFLVTELFYPLPLWSTNASEVAVVGSFLPLALACFCEPRAISDWAARNRRALIVWVVGLLAMLAWMVLPIPGRFAPGLNLVQGPRLLWGFGLLLLVGLVVIASEARWRISRARVAVFVLLVAAGWAISKLWLAKDQLDKHQFDWRVAVFLLLLVGLARLVPRLLPPRRVVLGAVLLTSLMTFGRFNPVQPAGPLFSPPPSLATEALRAYGAANPKRTVVAIGEYGATLNGLGLRSVNHTLVRPQQEFFRAAYPAMEPQAFNSLFNRYEHVMPALVWSPVLVQPDVIAIPPDPFAIPLPVDLAAAATAAPPGEGAIESATATSLGGGRWGVLIGGWAGWRGVSPDQRLGVALEPGGAAIVSATAFRLPRPDLAQSQNAPEKFAAGFGLRLVIQTPDGAAPAANLVRVTALDSRGAWALPRPRIQPEGPPVVVWPTPPIRGG